MGSGYGVSREFVFSIVANAMGERREFVFTIVEIAQGEGKSLYPQL